MSRIVVFVALLGSLSIACGGAGSFSGSVRGNELDVRDAVFYVSEFGAPGFGGSGVALVMSDQTNACTRLKENHLAPNGTMLSVGLGVSGGGTSITPLLTNGDYRLFTLLDLLNPPPAGTRLMISSFEKLDAGCVTTLGSQGVVTAGNVTVDSFKSGSGGHVTGNFTLSFGVDEGEGTFSADFCDFDPSDSLPAQTCT